MIKVNVAEIKKRLVGEKTLAYDLEPSELEITADDLDVIGGIRLDGKYQNPLDYF